MVESKSIVSLVKALLSEFSITYLFAKLHNAASVLSVPKSALA